MLKNQDSSFDRKLDEFVATQTRLYFTDGDFIRLEETKEDVRKIKKFIISEIGKLL